MKYVVGKPSILTAILLSTFYSLLGVAIYIFTPWEGMNYAGIVIIFLSIFVIFPEAACSELMWEIDTQTLKFTNYSKGIDKILTFYQQLFVAKRFPYQVVINLEQIDYIAVTYAKVPRAPFGAMGYDVWFNIHTYDGSVYSFISLTLSGKKDFNQAVDFMKEQGIHFKDGYHILDALHSHEHLSYYLERIDKEQSK